MNSNNNLLYDELFEKFNKDVSASYKVGVTTTDMDQNASNKKFHQNLFINSVMKQADMTFAKNA
jgi:hypothetical protein